MNESKLVRDSLSNIAPNNSDKAKQQEKKPGGEKPAEGRKKLKPIVKGKVTKKKKTVGEKFKEAFFGDVTGNLGDYIVHDVLVPALKTTVEDMVKGGIEMLLHGAIRGSRGVTRDRGRSYISYNTLSSDRNRRDYRDDDRREVSRSTRSRHDFDNVIFDSRGEAEDVLSHLVDLTLEYGEATVAAFYELSNIEADFTDDKYGWTNLRDAYTERARGGYIIRFPQTRPLT